MFALAAQACEIKATLQAQMQGAKQQVSGGKFGESGVEAQTGFLEVRLSCCLLVIASLKDLRLRI
jgi:hypothetical protein